MINKVLQGDCLELMRNIPDKSIDMVLCELPYGTTACKWDVIIPFDLLWEQYKRIIKDNGAIVLFGSEPFSSALRMSNIKNYKYDWKWFKNRPSGMSYAKHQPMRAIEDVLVFNISGCKYNPIMTLRTEQELKRFNKNKITITSGNQTNGLKAGMCKTREDSKYKYPINVLQFKTVSNSIKEKTAHPTQKPVAIFEYLIKTYTNEGDVVLDNCAGSGTTAIACMNTNRNYILMEKEQKYFDIINKRIETHIKKEG